MIKVRKAVTSHRRYIAYCIAEAFEKDFSTLSRDTQKVTTALEGGIHIERFFVAEENEKRIVGALALADSNGRSISMDAKSYKKYFGFSEYKREKVKNAKQKCFSKKIFMKYNDKIK